MKFAVVINVAAGERALAHAVKTQALLIEQLGPRLQSVRLAVPRLLSTACLGAVKDEPDILVVAGGPRAARCGGQIAYETGLPILFLPGLRRSPWANKLWKALSLEDMIGALAREEFLLATLGAGVVRGQIFFGGALCGLMPELAQRHRDFTEAETFEERWTILMRSAGIFPRTVRPAFSVHCDGALKGRATALVLSANGLSNGLNPGVPHQTVTRLQPFGCTTWRHGNAFSYAQGMMRAAFGKDWRGGASETFDCARMSLDGAGAASLVLDEDIVSVEGVVDFRYLPRAIKTFSFEPIQHSQSSPPLALARRPSAGLFYNR